MSAPTTTETDDEPLAARIRRNPRPAALWGVGLAVLLVLEFGAVAHGALELLHIVLTVIPGNPAAGAVAGLVRASGTIPTLLSRGVFPNEGYWNGQQWVGTFLGLSPAVAWAIRASMTFGYAFAFVWWCWRGYLTYRDHYRYADWTPRDDQVDRFSRHSWGKFGLGVVFLFVVLAVFAPTLGPATLQHNIVEPYSHSFKYWSQDAGTVKSTTDGAANFASTSKGDTNHNVGPLSYDAYGRFHPFGTLPSGKDLFTFMVFGSRISLFIAVASITVAGVIAIGLALVTAYFKGLTDLFVVVVSDSTQSLPVLMLAILIVVLFQGTWLAGIYNGAVLLIVLFSLVYWPFLWRAVRGPTFQVSEQDWIDAARSFGQRPTVIMRKHMLPYVVGYLLIYGSLSLGGIIISVAGLSYLGLGIAPPTPEWGRAVSAGQPFVASPSWHVALIPGVMITLVVTGLNAFGDGIRDAIDPQSEGGTADEAAVGGGA